MVFLLSTYPRQSDDEDFILYIYNEYIRLMYFTASRFIEETDSQNDIVQESLLQLIKNVSTLRELEPKALSTYVVTTVKNVSINYLKKEQAIQEHTVQLNATIMEELESTAPTLDELMSALDNKERLTSALINLSVDERLLLESKYYLGYSNEDLAHIFNCKPSSIRMKLTRARRKALKAFFDDEVIDHDAV